MLQFRALNRAILDDPTFRSAMVSPAPRGEGLEHHVDATLEAMRAERARRARQTGGLSHVAATVDAALRTNAVEHMDAPDYPETGKLKIALGLHLMNVASASYRRFFGIIEPMLRDIEQRYGRPARLLELASGAGGFAFALDALARHRNMRVEVTASDIVPLYVERGRERARREGVSVTFRTLDALDMSGVDDDAYDLVFVAQSIHHFSPGQIGRMIAEVSRVATTGFVSIDGFRSLGMLGFVAGTAILSFWPAMVHDATISARKFYPEGELEAIARIAAPTARIALGRIRPLNTVLTVLRHAEGA